MLVYCTKCGHNVSTTAVACPGCGAPPYRAANPSNQMTQTVRPVRPAVATWEQPTPAGDCRHVAKERRARCRFVGRPAGTRTDLQREPSQRIRLAFCLRTLRMDRLHIHPLGRYGSQCQARQSDGDNYGSPRLRRHRRCPDDVALLNRQRLPHRGKDQPPPDRNLLSNRQSPRVTVPNLPT